MKGRWKIVVIAAKCEVLNLATHLWKIGGWSKSIASPRWEIELCSDWSHILLALSGSFFSSQSVDQYRSSSRNNILLKESTIPIITKKKNSFFRFNVDYFTYRSSWSVTNHQSWRTIHELKTTRHSTFAPIHVLRSPRSTVTAVQVSQWSIDPRLDHRDVRSREVRSIESPKISPYESKRQG